MSFLTSPLQLPPTWDRRWWVERFGPGNPPSPAAVNVRTSCSSLYFCWSDHFFEARYSWCYSIASACQDNTPTLPSSLQDWKPQGYAPCNTMKFGAVSIQGMTGHRKFIPSLSVSVGWAGDSIWCSSTGGMYGLVISSQLPKVLVFLDSHMLCVSLNATFDTESSATLVSSCVRLRNLKQVLRDWPVKPLVLL